MWSPSEIILDGHPWLTHACCFRRPWTCNWPNELHVFIERKMLGRYSIQPVTSRMVSMGIVLLYLVDAI